MLKREGYYYADILFSRYFIHTDATLGTNLKDSVRVQTKATFLNGSSHNHISIEGSTGVAVAMGLHIYLKNYCNSHVSWEYIRIGIFFWSSLFLCCCSL